MTTFIVIVAIIIILYFVLKKKGATTQLNSPQNSNNNNTSNSEPRNYLEEATDFVGAPAPLSELLKTNREEVIHNLVNSLNLNPNVESQGIPMGPTIRKAAAYALGQIGEPSTVNILKMRLNIEQASGVRDAIIASISAINLAPDGPDYTQIDRQRIIEDVYKGRRSAQLESWK
jgi:hypothetical protein